MQRMDADKQIIIVPIYQTNCFLLPSRHLNFLQTGKSAYAIVDVGYIISRLKRFQFPQRHGFGL